MNDPTPRTPTAPLADIRVCDVTQNLAGPFCAQILADLGATVIKVEPPGGDLGRLWGPPFWGDDSTLFLSANRGKRSIIADFGKADDLARVRGLARDADVLIENFKTGGLTKFGLDFQALAAINPALVYCSITGFGQTGPRAQEPGYDFVIQGMSGFMSVTGQPESVPVKMGVSISDLTTGVYSANAIQAALIQRGRTGKGQHIDMALLDCSVALLANQASYHFTTGENPPRMGNAHAQVAPYGVFPVQDGHVILAPANDRLFVKLIEMLGLPNLADDPRFSVNGGRVENSVELDAEIAKATADWSKGELLKACAKHGVPAGPINNLDEVFSDPQVLARRMRVDLGGMPGVRSPFTFSDAELALDRPSPMLGEDD